MSLAFRLLILCALLLEPLAVRAQSPNARVVIDPKPLWNIFPGEAIGMGIDGGDHGTTDRLMRPDAVRALRSLGTAKVTYRLRTELAIEAWHWNPSGAWSDPAHQSGYFTGAIGGTPIQRGWGYRLPRRGSTVDQANNDGYSRLDDGDPATYWKSNPYLDPHFTGEPESAHPQWFVVDLGAPKQVNAIRLQWAVPYATQYRVEYCTFSADAPAKEKEFVDTFSEIAGWKPFSHGDVMAGRGGDETIRLEDAPVTVRFLRVVMTSSSHTAAPGSRDLRDRLGFAVREVGVGTVSDSGSFLDLVSHTANGKTQTPIVCSSTDPWHRASDRDLDTEQPGFDAFAGARLHRGQPILFPVGVLYDTPENAVALLRYVRRRHIPIGGIELGEEPDGQYISPEDYGALYRQFARALHAVDPKLRLGGPSLQTATDGWIFWPDTSGDRSWMRRFVQCLRAHRALDDFAFFSFEWYPFDDMRPGVAPELQRHPAMLDASVARLKAEGVPTGIPWLISELGWSAFTTVNEVDLPGALLDAETVGRFLSQQPGAVYFYGVEPGDLQYEDDVDLGTSWGGLRAFLTDSADHVRYTLPAAWTMRLLTGEWMQRGADRKPHAVYAAHVEALGTAGVAPSLGVYALRRPDKQWALLLINRETTQTVRVQLPGAMRADAIQYGPAQYQWHADGRNGHPGLSLPPAQFRCGNTVSLPPFSLTVVRWKGSAE